MSVMTIASKPAEMKFSELTKNAGARPIRGIPMIAPSIQAVRPTRLRDPKTKNTTIIVAIKVRSTTSVKVLTPSANTTRTPTPASPHPMEAAMIAMTTRGATARLYLAKETRRPGRISATTRP